MYLIVGLGNPGEEYRDTRHNIGFRVLEEAAKSLCLGDLKFKRKLRAFMGEAERGGSRVLLCEPQTFMNLSGEAVREALSWHKVAVSNMIVAYDDVDLEVGQLRVREGGGSGGHHGIESIVDRIGTPDFIRVRIGIGRPTQSGDVSGYVLERVPAGERAAIDSAVMTAAEAILHILDHGLEKTKNKYNGIKPPK